MFQDVSMAPSNLRVAFVSGGLKLGGSTTFLCNLAGELVSRGIPSQIFSFEQENPLAADFERLGVEIFTHDERKIIFEDRLRLNLERLREFRPTVVVACLSAISFEVLRYVPAGVFRVGMVQSHDPGVYKMVKAYAGVLDLMTGVSKTIAATIAAVEDFAIVQVAYLPYGVPMPATAPIRRFHAKDPLRILYLGRLEQEQKRVRLFPGIFEQLKSSKIPFHMTVVGEGPEKPFLESLMKSAPNQTVSFPGKVLYAAVPEVLSSHDVFLLTSDYEGLPLSLVEAMGYGLVPVVSDLESGIRDLVNESNGKRVDPNHLEGYAKAILWLHEHRAEITRMAQLGAEKVSSEFSVKAMADRWLAILPSQAPKIAPWPDGRKIRPPLIGRNALRFSTVGRVLRRLIFKIRRARVSSPKCFCA